jgi:hypothetical protein
MVKFCSRYWIQIIFAGSAVWWAATSTQGLANVQKSVEIVQSSQLEITKALQEFRSINFSDHYTIQSSNIQRDVEINNLKKEIERLQIEVNKNK